jgi:hypothetical protein
MSIIGNINTRAQEIRSKMTGKPNENAKVSQFKKFDEIDDDNDPLSQIVMELSEEVDPSERDSRLSKLTQNNDLNSTIIIGDIEEGNIFDEIKMK